jgi:hypothetical protein
MSFADKRAAAPPATSLVDNLDFGGVEQCSQVLAPANCAGNAIGGGRVTGDEDAGQCRGGCVSLARNILRRCRLGCCGIGFVNSRRT